MLPVSHNHRLVIPHRLALVAALLCLILSFGASHKAVDEQARIAHSGTIEQIEPAAGADKAALLPCDEGAPRQQRPRSGHLKLSPWFFGQLR